MAIITPRRQTPSVTQQLQLLGSGVDRFIGARRQKTLDEQEAERLAQQGRISGLQEKSLTQDTAREEEIAGLEKQFTSLDAKPLDPTLPPGEQGPQRSPEFMAQAEVDKQTQKKGILQKILVKRGKVKEAVDIDKTVDPDQQKLSQLKTKLDIAETIKEIDKIAKGGADITDKTVDIEFKLKNATHKAIGDFKTQRGAMSRLLESFKVGGGGGDLAFIFNFMKVNDPGSVVRESEFATAQKARGFLEKVESGAEGYKDIFIPTIAKQALLKAIKGETLTLQQKQNFMETAYGMYRGAEETAKQEAADVRAMGERYRHLGVDPDVVTRLVTLPGNSNEDIQKILKGELLPKTAGIKPKPKAGAKIGRFSVTDDEEENTTPFISPLKVGQTMTLDLGK